MAALYPDISHYHPVSDWDAAKENCPFLISKATEGRSFIDSTLDSFITGCEAYEIPYWLYTYLDRGNELAQAQFLVNVCAGKVGSHFMGYALDVEAGNAAANVQQAVDYLASLGGKFLLYTMYAQQSTYKSVIMGRPANCVWWEARYGLNDGTYNSKYPAHSGADLHQYTSKGECIGITGNCDLSRITGDNGIAEDWFTDVSAAVAAAEADNAGGYTGTFPALPPRGYYKQGDGITTLTNYPTQLKRVQMLTNWINDGSIDVDGKYGEKTAAAVKAAQEIIGVSKDGLFGAATLAAAKAYRK